MNPNPFLRKLGFSATDRVVILHADDIGMCHSSQVAYEDLIDYGLLSSAATMVPCGWFPATAAYCRANGDNPRMDMGVHLTVTCEWDTPRWGPVSGRDPATGLMDDEGYFFRRAAPVQAGADGAAVVRELRAQVRQAQAAGIDITHVDSHMFALAHHHLLPAYLQVAQEFGLPAFLPNLSEAQLRRMDYDERAAAILAGLVVQVGEAGLPLFDYVNVLSLDDAEDRLGQMKQVLAEVPAGLSNIIIHPCVDTPEIRAIAPDWRCRVADHALFTSPGLRQALDEAGVQVIGFRALRDAMR